jgi:hypothetical protein
MGEERWMLMVGGRLAVVGGGGGSGDRSRGLWWEVEVDIPRNGVGSALNPARSLSLLLLLLL